MRRSGKGALIRRCFLSFSSKEQAWEFPKLVEEFSDGGFLLGRRVDDDSHRLLVEDVHEAHDLLLASVIADVHIFQEPVISSLSIVGPGARDPVLLEIVSEVPGIAGNDERHYGFVLQIVMNILSQR